MKFKIYYHPEIRIREAIIMPSAASKDVTPCRPAQVHQNFGATYYLHPED
jgi:hypothetical protein